MSTKVINFASAEALNSTSWTQIGSATVDVSEGLEGIGAVVRYTSAVGDGAFLLQIRAGRSDADDQYIYSAKEIIAQNSSVQGNDAFIKFNNNTSGTRYYFYVPIKAGFTHINFYGRVENAGGSPTVDLLYIKGKTQIDVGNLAMAMSGPNVYSELADDFNITVNTGAKTVDVTGLKFTLAAKNVAIGKAIVIDSVGDVEEVPVSNVTVSGDTITFGNKEENFASGDIVMLFLIGPYKGYDADQGVWLFNRNDPEWAHYTDVVHLVDEANIAAATYYKVFDLEGYRSGAFQVLGSGGVTITAYMTLSEDAPDNDETDTQWEDVTNDLFGSATVVDTGALGWIETLRMPKKILFKYVTSDASNAVDIWARKY